MEDDPDNWPLVKRLRVEADSYVPDSSSLLIEAADEIERLQSLLGAVTPGPSARQIIRERIARLSEGQID